jgi:hypothetical protein
MGEDPLQTDAELSAVRKAFETLRLQQHSPLRQPALYAG